MRGVLLHPSRARPALHPPIATAPGDLGIAKGAIFTVMQPRALLTKHILPHKVRVHTAPMVTQHHCNCGGMASFPTAATGGWRLRLAPCSASASHTSQAVRTRHAQAGGSQVFLHTRCRRGSRHECTLCRRNPGRCSAAHDLIWDSRPSKRPATASAGGGRRAGAGRLCGGGRLQIRSRARHARGAADGARGRLPRPGACAAAAWVGARAVAAALAAVERLVSGAARCVIAAREAAAERRYELPPALWGPGGGWLAAGAWRSSRRAATKQRGMLADR